MKKELEKLGFTPNEITVYTALLTLGQTATGAIIKKTGLHRNIVYETLDALIKRSLVSQVIKDKKKYFCISSPAVLVDNAKEYYTIAQKIAKTINKKRGSRSPEIIVYEGKEGWETAYERLMCRLKKNNEIFTLGAGGDKWVSAMGNMFLPYETFCTKNNIAIRMIAYEWQRDEITAHQNKLIRQTKYLPNNYEIPSNTEIHIDGIFIQIYTEPLILIEIKSNEVRNGYLQHFNTLWRIARK